MGGEEPGSPCPWKRLLKARLQNGQPWSQVHFSRMGSQFGVFVSSRVAAGSQGRQLLVSCFFALPGSCGAAFAQVSVGGGSWEILKNPSSIRALFHLVHAQWAPSSVLRSPPPSVRDDVSATLCCGLPPARSPSPPSPPRLVLEGAWFRIRSMWRRVVRKRHPQGKVLQTSLGMVHMLGDGQEGNLVVRQPSSTTNSRSDTAAELRNGSCLPTCLHGSCQPLGENVRDLRDRISKWRKDRHCRGLR